jgi:hypothetical protein
VASQVAGGRDDKDGWRRVKEGTHFFLHSGNTRVRPLGAILPSTSTSLPPPSLRFFSTESKQPSFQEVATKLVLLIYFCLFLPCCWCEYAAAVCDVCVVLNPGLIDLLCSSCNKVISNLIVLLRLHAEMMTTLIWCITELHSSSHAFIISSTRRDT